jgi:hypothetical protein
MKKQVGLLVSTFAALVLLSQGAEAWWDRRIDPRVTAAGLAVGAGSTAAFFALNDWRWNSNGGNNYSGLGFAGAYAATSIGCIAVSPMVATAVVRRPLTYREAHVLAAGCVVPIIGPLLVNAAYDANPHWEPRPARRR